MKPESCSGTGLLQLRSPPRLWEWQGQPFWVRYMQYRSLFSNATGSGSDLHRSVLFCPRAFLVLW